MLEPLKELKDAISSYARRDRNHERGRPESVGRRAASVAAPDHGASAGDPCIGERAEGGSHAASRFTGAGIRSRCSQRRALSGRRHRPSSLDGHPRTTSTATARASQSGHSATICSARAAPSRTRWRFRVIGPESSFGRLHGYPPGRASHHPLASVYRRAHRRSRDSGRILGPPVEPESSHCLAAVDP